MKVVAIRAGYYQGKIVQAGEAFALGDTKEFSPRWMEVVTEEPSPHHTKRVRRHRSHR